MSNRDFDDDFNFDNDFGSDDDAGSPFGDDFGDDELPGGFDDDLDADAPDLTDDEEISDGTRGGGPNRTFVLIAGIMIALFVVGLGVLVFLITRDTGPTPLEQTATSIVMTNEEVFRQATGTSAAVAAFSGTQTIEAQFTNTEPPRPTVTPTFTPTATSTLDPTALAGIQLIASEAVTLANQAQAAADQAQQAADAAEDAAIGEAQEALAEEAQEAAEDAQDAADAAQEASIGAQNASTPEEAQAFVNDAQQAANDAQTALAETQNAANQVTGGTAVVGIDEVGQTATALVATLFGAGTPTIDTGIGGGADGAFPTQEQTQLPQGGIFDSVVVGGRDSVGMIVLIAFGLVGVIFVSRRLRAVTDK